MKRNIIILCLMGLFLLFALDASTTSQTPGQEPKVPYDTSDIAVIYSTAYPGTDGHLIEVKMLNRQEVLGYNLSLVIGYSVIGHFSTDTLGDCIVDTTGCLASYLSIDSCKCYSDDCYAIVHAASTYQPPWIPKRSNYSCLFKAHMDMCCIPDSVHHYDRDAMITVSGQLYGSSGYQIPWRAHPGAVSIWWGVPGDANADSTVDMGDITFISNYLWRQGPLPCVCEAADCNADTTIDIGDVVYLINYLYKNGPAPLPGVYACWHLDCRP